jgi:cysteine synthase B
VSGLAARSARIGSLVDAVGHTPHLRLRSLERAVRARFPEANVELWLKLELANPGGSVKDRAALRMMLRALSDGRLREGKTLIDSTSGNTGVAYSLFGAALGVPVTLVMPSNVSRPRKDIARAFGTELIWSDPLEGSDGAIRRVRDIVAEDPERWFYPDQYSNPDNPGAHYHGTGRELVAAFGDRLTHFVAGLGTSGTIMGTSRRLREHAAARGAPIRCIAVEPDEPMHGLEGLKHLPSSLEPAIHSATGYDETRRVGTEPGWDMADRLARDEAIHVGHSSGANVEVAFRLALELAERGQRGTIVTIACDRGDRYFAPARWEKRYEW